MRKIPTLFVRDPEDMRRVIDKVTPGCEWVLAGEGVATRKYDGTCVMLDEAGKWWARREVKPGKAPPPGWVEADHDEVTGKRPGWEPMDQSPFVKMHAEAVNHWDRPITPWRPGTYELLGPKINGNPEHADGHALIRHGDAETLGATGMNFNDLRSHVLDLATEGIEGIVWHHPDGRMAKLKGRDFPPTAEADTSAGGL